MTKFCVDCKWMGIGTGLDQIPLCKRPGLGREDLVHGEMVYYPTCEVQRTMDADWLLSWIFGRNCGPKAKFFQAKESKP